MFKFFLVITKVLTDILTRTRSYTVVSKVAFCQRLVWQIVIAACLGAIKEKESDNLFSSIFEEQR